LSARKRLFLFRTAMHQVFTFTFVLPKKEIGAAVD